MALQDLTPQLRTRLSRMERAVGWFVFLAILLLGFGFVYYVYDTAERKGWFLNKARYFTFAQTATGLKVGDPVMLMGFAAGSITAIKPMPAEQFTYNVYVEFELKDPNYGYMWSVGSRAKIATADLLGKRVLEVTKGTGGYPTYIFYHLMTANTAEIGHLPDASHWLLAEEVPDPNGTNLLARPLQPVSNLSEIIGAGYKTLLFLDTNSLQKKITAMWNEKENRYEELTPTSRPYYLHEDESPAVSEQLQRMVTEVEQALPNVFNLTNILSQVLSNSATLTSNLNSVALAAQPTLSNLTAATKNLDQPGSLGQWLIPTNLNHQLAGTLSNASATLVTANTNLAAVAENLNRSLDNLSDLTSNLNQQVQANSNMLSSISETVTHADEFVQGLKKWWLFRHLFKPAVTNAPAASPPKRVPPPKGAELLK
jgi:ABC-type transporter Mla subunit MlaD